MAMFVAGKSGNPKGRPVNSRYSALCTKGRIERFLYKNLTQRSMNVLFNKLTPSQQAEFITQLLPYILPKQSAEALSTADIEKIYQAVEAAGKQINSKAV